MIAYLKGKILKKSDKGIILKTGDIGYFVYVNKLLLPEISESEDLELFIHHITKEDASDLYGFKNYNELQFFTQLISVNGVGPKVALEILSVDTDKIKSAIANEDDAFICKIPGIGKKTAKRLIIDLKDKIDSQFEDEKYKKQDTGKHNDAIDALMKLGYQRRQVSHALKDMPQDIIEAEEIITYFLKTI